MISFVRSFYCNKNLNVQYLSLMLTYRTTHLPWCGLSPAKLLMGRKLRAKLPLVTEQLKPHWNFRIHDKKIKGRIMIGVTEFALFHLIPDDSEVWITFDRNQIIPGNMTGERETPRSYNVSTSSGTRNRYHLNIAPLTAIDGVKQPTSNTESSIIYSPTNTK